MQQISYPNRLLRVLTVLLFGLSASMASATQVSSWGLAASLVGQPPDLSSVVDIDGGTYFSVALKNDGTVMAWGDNIQHSTEVPTGLSDVVQVACMSYAAMALKSNGTIVTWGDNYWTQCNLPTHHMGKIVAISGGCDHGVALNDAGMVICWGSNAKNQRNVPISLQGSVQAISAGALHNMARKQDGTVVCWGDNAHGQSTVPAALGKVNAISAGYYHSLALKTDGTVAAWGLNSSGQTSVPSGLTGVVAIAAGLEMSLALKADGTVVAWGSNPYGQLNVPAGLSGVKSIRCGAAHSFALASDATPAAPVVMPFHALVAATGASGFSYQPVAYNLPTSWSISPALPAGMTISPTTGLISGTPTVAASGKWTVTVTNAAGSTTSDFSLTVNDASAVKLWDAVDYPTPIFTTGKWQTTAVAAKTTDGTDAVSQIELVSVYNNGAFAASGSNYAVMPNVRGPARLSWKQTSGSFPFQVGCQVTNTVNYPLPTVGLPEVSPVPNQSLQRGSIDLGPGMNTAEFFVKYLYTGFMQPGQNTSVYPYNFTALLDILFDQVTVEPIPTTTLETALDLPSAQWTTSSGAAWSPLLSGAAKDGVDYVAASASALPGEAIWLQKDVTGPKRITFSWYNNAPAHPFTCSVDGQVAATYTVAQYYDTWLVAEVDVPAGPHTVRWVSEATHIGTPHGAALDNVIEGEIPTFQGALGTPSLTWTTGGSKVWKAGNPPANYYYWPQNIAYWVGNNGATGWLETTLTGPGLFECKGTFDAGSVSLDALTVSLNGTPFWKRISIPAGTHTLRFTASSAVNSSSAAYLDEASFVSTQTTFATAIGQPDILVVECYSGTSRVALTETVNGGVDQVMLAFPSSNVPRVLAFDYLQAANVYSNNVRIGEFLHPLPSPTNTTKYFQAMVPAGTTDVTLVLPYAFLSDTFSLTTSTAVSLAEALDTATTVTGSGAAATTGWTANAAIATGADLVDLYSDTSDGSRASAQITVTGPVQVLMDFRGLGEYQIDSASAVAMPNEPWTSANDPRVKTHKVFVASGVTSTIRWISFPVTAGAAYHLYLDNLRVISPTSVSLVEALDLASNSVVTTGGSQAWAGWNFEPYGNGLGEDFAQVEHTAAAESSWLAGTYTGPMLLHYRIPGGGKFKIFINDQLRADTALLQSLSGELSILPADLRSYRWRIEAEGAGKFQIGDLLVGSRSLPGTYSPISQGTEVVYATNGGFDHNFFLMGPASISINAGIEYYRSRDILPNAEASLTYTATGSTPRATTNVSSPFTLNLNAGMTLLNLHGVSGQIDFSTWPQEYRFYTSSAYPALRSFRAVQGNTEFEYWLASNGLGSFDGGVNGDSDGDGVTNGVEFALGLNPNSTDQNKLVVLKSPSQLSVQLPISPNYTLYNTTLIFQTSTNLRDWADAPASSISPAFGAQGRRVFRTSTVGIPNLFVRPKVTFAN